MAFEKPKISTCKDCKKPIEWRVAGNGSGKQWPYDLGGGDAHFKTCENRKPFVAKCKFCQVEIEWKERKPFNLDGVSHFETCSARQKQGASAHEDPLF